MALKLRIQWPGAIYLVMNRGGPQRKAIFRDDDDHQSILMSRMGVSKLSAQWEPARPNGSRVGALCQCEELPEI